MYVLVKQIENVNFEIAKGELKEAIELKEIYKRSEKINTLNWSDDRIIPCTLTSLYKIYTQERWNLIN